MEILNQPKVVLLIIGFLVLLLSIFFNVNKNYKAAHITLLLAGTFLFLFVSILIPYINLWDERFHALVAKNMLLNPFKPTLYAYPIVNTAYDGWDKAHVWLHKQPLFLWQIVLSYKLFGVSEFAVRLPSAILGVCFIHATYQSGSLLGNKNIGYYAGFLCATSFFFLQLIAGVQLVDQNDVSFVVYISLSLWALLKYVQSENKWWLVAIGIFAGFAVLCKWLVGLLVYLVWGVFLLLKRNLNVTAIKPFLYALLITIMIVLPWQIFIFWQYPLEAKQEFGYNFLHLVTAIEGKEEGQFFHFKMIGQLFGNLVPWLILPSLYLFYKKSNYKNLSLALIIGVVFVYLFFTLAVTKMPAFTMILALPIFISLGFFINFISDFIARKLSVVFLHKLLIFSVLFFIAYGRISLDKLVDDYGLLNDYDAVNESLIENKKIFKDLNLPPHTVLFNVKGRHYVEAMFYTTAIAYPFVPSILQCKNVTDNGYKIAIFESHNDKLPVYLLQNKNVILIKENLNVLD